MEESSKYWGRLTGGGTPLRAITSINMDLTRNFWTSHTPNAIVVWLFCQSSGPGTPNDSVTEVRKEVGAEGETSNGRPSPWWGRQVLLSHAQPSPPQQFINTLVQTQGEKTDVDTKQRHHAYIRTVLEAITQARWLHTGDRQASATSASPLSALPLCGLR